MRALKVRLHSDLVLSNAEVASAVTVDIQSLLGDYSQIIPCGSILSGAQTRVCSIGEQVAADDDQLCDPAGALKHLARNIGHRAAVVYHDEVFQLRRLHPLVEHSRSDDKPILMHARLPHSQATLHCGE